LRFAEALLNYAEAKEELGTITQADLDASINLLSGPSRHATFDDGRGNGSHDMPMMVFLHLIVEIRRERSVELFMEGFRYDDLRRWKGQKT
jgi:hypothetical protein